MTNGTDRVAAELTLDTGEALILAVMQYAMLCDDLDADSKATKHQVVANFESALLDQAGALPAEVPSWCVEVSDALADMDRLAQRKWLRSAPALLTESVDVRSRALLLFIELVTFEPWPAGTHWNGKARDAALDELGGTLHAMATCDVEAVTREYAAVLSALRRRTIRWGRLAIVSVVGLGLGAITAGMAAPLIGAAVGATAGLTGAAATSAGLATLGGGSLAAGGFGVAGGTALITGLGAVTGAGVAATGTRIVGWSSGQIVADAIKLDLITRLVFLDAQNDDEKARRVVEGLQVRLTEVTGKIAQLAEQLRVLAEDNTRLRADNTELRDKLREQHTQAQLAGTALEIVLDRLPASAR